MTNSKVLSRACPICDGPRGEVLQSQRFVLPKNHPLQSGYDVVCCEVCGFCFADTAATQHDYDKFYTSLSKYSDSKTSTGAGLAPWDAERLRVVARDLAAFATNQNARIADIGCANGGLLRELRALGFSRLCGIDPSPACIKQTAAAVADAESYIGSLFNLPQEAGIFDGIVLSHVLEHVRDLRPALVALRQFLSPKGWIYIETPDAMRYKDYVVSPFQDFNTEHINHFSQRSMLSLIQQCGFDSAREGARTILSAPHMPYPVTYVFAELTKEGRATPVEKDSTLRSALLEYIATSRALMEKIDARLKQYTAEHSQLIVWGTGQLTTKLLAETSLAQARILSFVDSNPASHGKLLREVPVIAPEAIKPSDVPILIASTINAQSIAENIRQLGLPNPVLTLKD